MPTKNIRLPAGYKLIPVRTTYLEMKARPAAGPIALPDGWRGRALAGTGTPVNTGSFSPPWAAPRGWSGRLILDEGELAAVLRDGTTEIYRLRRRGETAGFAELDRGRPKEAGIAYFGLLPGFIGRGLGGFLLNWAIHRAWRTETERVLSAHLPVRPSAGAGGIPQGRVRHLWRTSRDAALRGGFIRNFRTSGG